MNYQVECSHVGVRPHWTPLISFIWSHSKDIKYDLIGFDQFQWNLNVGASAFHALAANVWNTGSWNYYQSIAILLICNWLIVIPFLKKLQTFFRVGGPVGVEDRAGCAPSRCFERKSAWIIYSSFNVETNSIRKSRDHLRTFIDWIYESVKRRKFKRWI